MPLEEDKGRIGVAEKCLRSGVRAALLSAEGRLRLGVSVPSALPRPAESAPGVEGSPSVGKTGDVGEQGQRCSPHSVPTGAIALKSHSGLLCRPIIH